MGYAVAKLGSEERAYCNRHGIPLDRLFDADGYKRASYKEIMGADEKWAAYGVKPCPNGHVLRNRHGFCLMCNPQTVAHMLRSKLPGYLYVAVGAGRELMKLGFSAAPERRIEIANYEGWGGKYDWRIVAKGWSPRGGKLEGEFHHYFKDRQVQLTWIRNGNLTRTREAFHADVPEACSKLVWLCDGPIEFAQP